MSIVGLPLLLLLGSLGTIIWIVCDAFPWIIQQMEVCLPLAASYFNTLKPRQNGRYFPDDTFKRIFLNENVWISTKISLKFVPKGPINNNPALVKITAWRRPGDKPLSEPMMVRLPTHICVPRPQWINSFIHHMSNNWACEEHCSKYTSPLHMIHANKLNNFYS